MEVKNRKLKGLILLTVVVLGITACEKDESLAPEIQEKQYLSSEDTQGMTKLGDQLENPYSVENMKIALDELRSSSNGRIAEDVEITTTHLYIRFVPKNEDELDILKRDSTLILYDIPLDYEIVEGGDFYHDQDLPLDQPTYQYTAVEIGTKLTDSVEYEILAELFIPEEILDEENSASRIGLTSNLADDLVDQALLITGNITEEELVAESSQRTAASKWRPAGYIQVYDDVLGRYTGMVGVEVRARRWFTTKRGYTKDPGGAFSCNGRFRRKANYSIKWERYNFSIRTGTFGQAKYDGPKIRGDWKLTFGYNGNDIVDHKQQYYALIFQGAYDYYYGNRFGLSSPPRNSTLKPQVKISASQTSRQHNKDSHAAQYARPLGVLPTVYIREWRDHSDEVYAVTCHELAHLAHWDMNRDAFRDVAKDAWRMPSGDVKDASMAAIIESWASGVEWQGNRI